MPVFLTQEWLDELRGDAAGIDYGDATGTVQHTVTGAPDGDVSYVLVFDGGKLREATLGTRPDADVTVTIPYADAVAVQQGELDPNVAFMRGRAKVNGDMGVLLPTMPATRTAEYGAMQEKLRASTTFL
ncbi:MAG TPA: SCP2 sterol-binding domain-containing protein [Acidimicrobiia bacterium]|nr:SCP2 sterol-binding domain-containing protein [Acidimicrobiia bacterium]